ncbi:MAG: ABC transporter permease [Anaerolineaceae bacterium]|nr:ABC transporter permease [Anaerolineaceae bacterium]
MVKYLVRRFLQAIPTLFGISIIAYFIMALAPGGPTRVLAFNPELTIQQREAMARAIGADLPIHIQYMRWLIGDAPIDIFGIQIWGGREIPVFDRRGNQVGTEIGTDLGVLRGDFGTSVISKRPVTEALAERIPATLELGVISLIVGLVVGLPVGVIAAVKQGSAFDQVTRVMAVVVSSIPVYWLGLILLLIFGATLQWLPMGNRFPLSFTGEYTLWDRIRHLILPVFTLSSFGVATFSRYMRASLLDVLNADYVRTARAKGLSDRSVWFGHAMRNALIPIATILGPAITLVISGAVLTETIYSWPGMGLLVVNAVRQSDYPVIMATVLLISVMTILGYILSDILYAVFDPRIRLS